MIAVVAAFLIIRKKKAKKAAALLEADDLDDLEDVDLGDDTEENDDAADTSEDGKETATGSPNSSVLPMMNTIRIIEIRKKSTPMTDASDSGATEKPVMPSTEYARSFRSGHFDVPAQRSSCSNSSHSV